jgi:methionyl aminopeptidase
MGLQAVIDRVEPGVTTEQLDQVFVQFLKSVDAESSFLGYHHYPKTICTSINNEVVHGIPRSDRVLQEGDIIGVDCGVRYKGYCTDMARTVPVGSITPELQRLLTVTEEAMRLGIAQLHPGRRIGDVGCAVQQHAEAAGFSVVRALVGHGVGHDVHEPPEVPNFGTAGTGLKLEAGMVLAVEPMVNIGRPDVTFDKADGWTVRTADGRWSAHFENTIAVLETGPEVLTRLA